VKTITPSNKVLITENGKSEYDDIVNCLPDGIIPTPFKMDSITADEAIDIDISIAKNELEDNYGEYYRLCICDLLEIKPIVDGTPLDSPIVFKDLKKGINRIAKLCSHFNSHFIIVTKIPV